LASCASMICRLPSSSMTWVFRVWRFFSPNSTLFALLSGGFMGLSITSTRDIRD
jgi:hypothetical protein